jgi:hypothetical protein
VLALGLVGDEVSILRFFLVGVSGKGVLSSSSLSSRVWREKTTPRLFEGVFDGVVRSLVLDRVFNADFLGDFGGEVGVEVGKRFWIRG